MMIVLVYDAMQVIEMGAVEVHAAIQMDQKQVHGMQLAKNKINDTN